MHIPPFSSFKFNIMFFSSTVIVALVAAALAPVTNAFIDTKKMTFSPFEEMRPKITFPSYTPEQRQTVADQADAILSVSVFPYYKS